LEQAETVLHRVTGWQSKSRAALKDFDLVMHSSLCCLCPFGFSNFKKWSSTQLNRLLSSKPLPNSHPNFITTMLASHLPPASALSEAKEMLGPGTDTTSATLAQDTSYQEALIHNLVEAQRPTDMSSLESILRLRAAIKEGIRWTGAAAAMLPRVVPEGGIVLAGVLLPGGV
jgi:hypothetical protein